MPVSWIAGLDNPGAKAFEDAWAKKVAQDPGWATKYGPVPDPTYTYFYNSLRAAVKAVELAGTDDPAKVAEAARSGKLEYQAAQGLAHVDTNGGNDLTSSYAKVVNGKLVVVKIPQ